MRNRNELFVVIATVSFLVLTFCALIGGTGCGKLSPLNAAKEKARQSDCVNKLKQIGLAAKQYAASYDDWLPTSSNVRSGGDYDSWSYAGVTPVWMNGRSGDTLDILRAGDFISDPKDFLCPSKDSITPAEPSKSVKGHVSYNWCDGLMDAISGMSPIACDGLDNHKSNGRVLKGDGSVFTANGSGDRKWTRDPIFKDACYNEEPPEYSF